MKADNLLELYPQQPAGFHYEIEVYNSEETFKLPGRIKRVEQSDTHFVFSTICSASWVPLKGIYMHVSTVKSEVINFK